MSDGSRSYMLQLITQNVCLVQAPPLMAASRGRVLFAIVRQPAVAGVSETSKHASVLPERSFEADLCRRVPN